MNNTVEASQKIDRLTPTYRPSLAVAGYQRWRSLLFMHWPIDADSLREVIPKSLELDLYNGQAYVGVVPFAMEGVRPHWWPEAWAFRFLETNVRTYVLHNGRPGVYFLSLDASSRLAVEAARLGWGLPYFYSAMSMEEQNGLVTYRTRRKGSAAEHRVRYRLGAHLGPSSPGSLEHFFLERYLLFVERYGRIFEGQVHHTPYPAQRVVVEEVHDELVAELGLPGVHGMPEFAHYARGVDVEIFPLRSVG
jgi:uncharacterized protein YqjF (DUF2071 family)